MIKNALWVFIVIFIYSCSSELPKRDPKEISTGMPDFFVTDFKIVTPLQSNLKIREPSSTDEDMAITAFSNRKIYFLTLLSQYYELKTISKIDSPDVKFCPSFHTEVVNNIKQISKPLESEYLVSKAGYDTKKIMEKNSDYLSLYPELSLPLTDSHSHPALLDVISGMDLKKTEEVFKKAFHIHLVKTFNEISELCEKGQTDNYFVFENLMTITKNHPEFKDSTKALKSMLKSSIFANMLVLKSLKLHSTTKSRSVASTYTSFEEEAFLRLDAKWLKIYFEQIKNRRLEVK